MYRYQKMMNEFLEMKEFKGYEMDYTILKGFYFECETKHHNYIIHIPDGAYQDPKIKKQRKKDKRFERIGTENLDSETYKLYQKIKKTIINANKLYIPILPGYRKAFGSLSLETKNMVENMPEYKKYPIEFPDRITIWCDLSWNNTYLFELKFSIINRGMDERTPFWIKGETNLDELETHKEYFLMEEHLMLYISEIVETLNKPYRLRHIYNEVNHGN